MTSVSVTKFSYKKFICITQNSRPPLNVGLHLWTTFLGLFINDVQYSSETVWHFHTKENFLYENFVTDRGRNLKISIFAWRHLWMPPLGNLECVALWIILLCFLLCNVMCLCFLLDHWRPAFRGFMLHLLVDVIYELPNWIIDDHCLKNGYKVAASVSFAINEYWSGSRTKFWNNAKLRWLFTLLNNA